MPAIPSPPFKNTPPKIGKLLGRGTPCYFYYQEALINQGRMNNYPQIGDWIGIGQTTYVIEKCMWTLESTTTKVVSISFSMVIVPPVSINSDSEPTREEPIQ